MAGWCEFLRLCGLHAYKCFIALCFNCAYAWCMRCAVCDELLVSRAGSVTCSTRCRVKLSRRTPPFELVKRDRWVRHVAKRPVMCDGRPASSTNADTWDSFDRVFASPVGDGFGFVLNGDGVACVDVDKCLVNGRVLPWARELVRLLPATYVEVSPSGRGLHIFGFAYVGTGWRSDGVEVYDRGRFMCVTGQRFGQFPKRLANIQTFVDWVMHG